MQPIQTIDEFFTRSGAEVSLYHMGRRVTPCSRETLAEFEQGQRPWPEPWQSQARIAAIFRLGDMPEPAIWFLALPLDEQGMLSPAQRDGFLNRLIETLGRNVSKVGHNAKDVDHFMKDNPLAFTPSITFQAMLNAYATLERNLPASQHFEPVEAYLTGQQQIDWQALGLQGIADFTARLDDALTDALITRLATLPTSVVHSLCYCLEHQPLSTAMALALRDVGEQAASQGDMETLCACIRAVGSTNQPEVGDWYTSLLADPHASGPDVMAAIAGRGWLLLEDAQRLPLFLNRLAEDERTNFAAVVRDIALIPRLRLPVMLALRDAPSGSAIQHRLATMTQATSR
ncbi:DUF3549 family protein [Vreelandella populi]|uniref:DUF3549 family protein n=1 Tax=Vreelandella populi TaxID=2498858 RepID=A0A3S0X3Z7_9GAMM|nr:DUF3549 family protein [Halomonas populi]RUR40930.1 DUF3549 family protein [Halomonas populi]RUR49441.1 DUF3549 family protein [Halomonas populi]RUR55924.1 DUF3549 family protein [Halomonas populi]